MEAPAEDQHLLLPDRDVADPEVTILVPALNEEGTIGAFVDWCQQGIAESGAAVEILIVDSSTDRTAEIARSKVPVICVPGARRLMRASPSKREIATGDRTRRGPDRASARTGRVLEPYRAPGARVGLRAIGRARALRRTQGVPGVR